MNSVIQNQKGENQAVSLSSEGSVLNHPLCLYDDLFKLSELRGFVKGCAACFCVLAQGDSKEDETGREAEQNTTDLNWCTFFFFKPVKAKFYC